MLRFIAIAALGLAVTAQASILPNVHCTSADAQVDFFVNYLPNGESVGSALTLGDRSVEMTCEKADFGFRCVEERGGDGRYIVITTDDAGKLLQEQMFPLPPAHVADLTCGMRI